MEDKRLADLADYLHELVRFRNNEQVQKEEFNNFSEVDACYYQDRTEEIYKLACEFDEKHDDHCDVKLMSLDEAIAHANDVADNDLCTSCASEHRQLANWLTELKDIKSKYAYLAADFDNYKKRTAKTECYAYDKGKEMAVLQFLNTYDDLERAIKSANSDSASLSADISPLESGIRIAFENLEKTLVSLGCKKIECTYGDKFDVNVMEAFGARQIREDEGYDPDDVVEIYQSGWKLNEKVIRPVKVIVGIDSMVSQQ